MGSLYERILGQHPSQPRMPVHPLLAVIAEWTRGSITTQQGQDILNQVSGAPLDTAGQQEAIDLRDTVTSAGSPASQVQRRGEIQDVLLLADGASPGYNTPAALRTRLGVPAR